MPGPAGAFALPGAVVAAKHLAVKATAYAGEATTFASAAFSAMIAKWLWKTCPEWLKEDISFKHLLRTSDNVTEEDLSHLGDIVNKLDELAKKSKEIDVDVPQLHAALLAYIQLTGQLKQSNLEDNRSKDKEPTRDHAYRNAGEKQPVESLWISEYREALKYATWAYFKDTEVLKIKLQKRGYELLTHNLSTRPGNVSYYLALSPLENTLIVGVRGTSSLEDILTDCCGSAVPLNKQDFDEEEENCMGDMGIEITDLGGIIEDDNSEKNIRCHEGILIASKRLLDEIDEHIKNWVVDAGWQVILCGHSLGAGAATIAAFLLRSRYPKLAEKENFQVEVYAFAPPPVVDHDSALAAKAFCTSFVHNSDLIPRCSMYNLAVFLECLLRVHERLVEEDMNPTSALSTAAFFKKLSQGSSGEPLLSELQMKEYIQNAQKKIEMRQPGHLFIPGTVYLSFNPWVPAEKEENEEDEIAWECVETDGTAAVFRYLELDGGRMFMDHVTSTYYEVLNMDYNL
ncbi:MAG: hypothetical protein SGBAC_000072 [Bacillariaceae sp.]